jgi:hypothetical protein
MAMPTVVRIKIGLQLLTNDMSISASFLVICLLWSIVSTDLAPDGNPHKNPSNIGITEFLDNLKIFGIKDK